MGQERCEYLARIAESALWLMEFADNLCFHRRACHARRITRMVPLDCSVLLLSGQGIQEVATLVREDPGCGDDYLLYRIQVCSFRGQTGIELG
jgi:hypothetical protein